MEKYFMCYYKARNGMIIVKRTCARDLLLAYLNKKGLNYCCNGKTHGSSIQLCFRLKSTGFRIRQYIYVEGLAYRCITQVEEKPIQSVEKQRKLKAQLGRINKTLIQGKLEYSSAEKHLRFVDDMSLKTKKGPVNIQDLPERFDQLIGQPHYLLDIEFADILLGAFK